MNGTDNLVFLCYTCGKVHGGANPRTSHCVPLAVHTQAFIFTRLNNFDSKALGANCKWKKVSEYLQRKTCCNCPFCVGLFVWSGYVGWLWFE